MTLTKAYMELLNELQRDDLSEYEKEALKKYSAWLSSIKSTVTNNKEFGIKQITDDEVRNHVIGIRNYCLSKTDCKDCLFKGKEGCDFVDNYMIPSQWHIPPHWRDEHDV